MIVRSSWRQRRQLQRLLPRSELTHPKSVLSIAITANLSSSGSARAPLRNSQSCNIQWLARDRVRTDQDARSEMRDNRVGEPPAIVSHPREDHPGDRRRDPVRMHYAKSDRRADQRPPTDLPIFDVLEMWSDHP